VLGQTFEALSNAGARLEKLKRQQATEKRSLEARENRAEREAAARVRLDREASMRRNRERYEKERNDLILTRQMDGAKLRAERLTVSQQREQVRDSQTRSPEPPVLKPMPVAEVPDRERAIQMIRERRERNRERDRGRDR
jgi:hypothetical protein